MYNGVSLFSGALGLDLGMEKAGIRTRICVEEDSVCTETIKLNWPKVPVIDRDIKGVSSREILREAGLKKKDVFVLYGGPPCQAFSTAGSRRSLEDTRGNCILEFVRKVSEIEPRYFIMENVRGLLSASVSPGNGNGRNESVRNRYYSPGGVVRYLIGLFQQAGYTVSFALFNSANYGVPQGRERMIFFGNRGKKRIPLPQPTHTADGRITGRRWTSLRSAFKGLGRTKHHYVEFSKERKRFYRLLKEGQNWRNLPPGLQKEAMGASYHLGGGKTGFYRRLSFDKPSPTLVTRPNMPATDLCHPTELRPLSVEEYKRLQEFPRDWKFAGSLLDQYLQIGNAVPVRMGHVVGKAIADFHEGRFREQKPNTVGYSRYKGTTDIDFLAQAEFQEEFAYAHLPNAERELATSGR